MEGHCSRPKAFDHKIHAVRKHSGQTEIARRVRELTKGSTMIGINPIDILRHFPKTIIVDNADFSVLTNRLTQLHNHLQKQIGITNNLEVQIKAKERLVNVERLLKIETAQDFLNFENLEKVMDFIPKLFCDFLLKYMPTELKNRTFWQDLVHIAKRKITPQDAYSIRCFPQVFGASLKAIEHAEAVISEELNAVVDNPIIFMENQILPDGTKVMENDVISGGNFHGQPIALVLDYMKLAVAEMGNIMERQINKMVDAATNDGLPPFLIQGAGLNNGLMIPQYTAASIVSENKVLVHPASADSIPTSANQEDHVSMGPIAGRQLLQIITNVQRILAIHILTAKQAVAMRLKQFDSIVPTQMAVATKELYDNVEALGVTTIEKDRFLWEDIDKLMAIVE
jgi:histidine ammonia-lyase